MPVTKKPERARLSDQKKPRMGRPPIAAEDRRTNLTKVLTTDAEQEDLQRAADVAGLPVSTWVRVAALEKARRSST